MSRVILVVAAHSDDEALGCAGTVARHVAEGDRVHAVFLADGVSSRTEQDKNVLSVREAAAAKAHNIMGFSTVAYLGLPDNRLDDLALLDIVQPLETVISEVSPEVIYTHHIGDLNVDHQITHKAVMTACRPQPGCCVKEIYTFEVLSSTEWQTTGIMPFTPNVFIDIGKYTDIKKRALEAYANEMREAPHTRSIINSDRINKIRGNAVGLDFAEAFMLIRKIS